MEKISISHTNMPREKCQKGSTKWELLAKWNFSKIVAIISRSFLVRHCDIMHSLQFAMLCISDDRLYQIEHSTGSSSIRVIVGTRSRSRPVPIVSKLYKLGWTRARAKITPNGSRTGRKNANRGMLSNVLLPWRMNRKQLTHELTFEQQLLPPI